MTTWNVFCRGRLIGTVTENSETLARCAALWKFGMDDDEFVALDERGRSDVRLCAIPPGEDFCVTAS